MKNLFLLIIVFLISFSSNACTDFSGNYQWENDWIIRMIQNSCESIMLIDEDENKLELKFNGEDLYLDSLGNTKFYTNNALVDEKWIIKNTTVTSQPNGDVITMTVLIERFLNANGDIVEIAHHQDGSISNYVFKRIN